MLQLPSERCRVKVKLPLHVEVATTRTLLAVEEPEMVALPLIVQEKV